MAIYTQEVIYVQAMMGSNQNDLDSDIQGRIQKVEWFCPALAMLSERWRVQGLVEAEQPAKPSRKPNADKKLTLTREHGHKTSPLSISLWS